MDILVDFEIGERVVYASHGIGEIVGIEPQSIGQHVIQVYVISLTQNNMTLKVPINRAISSGLRRLSSHDVLKDVYQTLESKPKIKSRMWSRRVQEYEFKLHSGDLVSVAEVVRDLYKPPDSNSSYSERNLYESALSRLASEMSALESMMHDEVVAKLTDILKSTRIAA
ncbi:MAG: CarD family transcriptional regulator [Rickettsiaceae bacterium]